MIFTAPSFLPTLPSPLPLQETVGDFCLTANLAKTAIFESVSRRDPFVEASNDRTWSALEIDARIAQVSAALCSSWDIVPGQQWHKTVAILASNSVDVLILSWAIHRIGGACLMLQPTSSAKEISQHLASVPPFAAFVSPDLLSLGQESIRMSSSSPKLPLYMLAGSTQSRHTAVTDSTQDQSSVPTLDDLIASALGTPPVQKMPLPTNEATRRVAYYCTTSGTSGFQRIVAATHENMIASILQAALFYKSTREIDSEVALCFLPISHIYGILVTHALMYYGDCIVVHHGFDMMEVMTSIMKYQINTLYLVPPIINALSRNASILERFDLSSVRSIVTGGGPLDKEAFAKMQAARPDWCILSGWGQTESCGIGSLSHAGDIFPGSSGVVLPGVRIRLRNSDGLEVEALENMGEIEIASPSVLRGHIDHASDAYLPETGDAEFWWSTGDVGFFRAVPSGEVHLFIVDRIRDMIKVKGIQVAPGQIEGHLSRHAAVAECAVIGVPDEIAGERALAFIVREPAYLQGFGEVELKETIRDYNDSESPEVCRLQHRIIFVDKIPKSASGKVLKRELRKHLPFSAPGRKRAA